MMTEGRNVDRLSRRSRASLVTRTLWLGFAAGLLAMATVVTAADSPAIPGVVKERPTSGRFVETANGFLVPYEQKIPGTDVTFTMQPIPGGRFRCGSPASETKRTPDEGPDFEVELPPFWMATHEITWAEYKQFMSLHDPLKKMAAEKTRPITPELQPWVITVPSKLYDPSFTYQLGEEPRQPAITMSQYAAKQYSKWLSGLTGQIYRLPTEAEWEYACRAGTTTAYSFGDDPQALKEHAWYLGNSKDTTHLVGQKKPNPWGLYDMHGNVAEWVLDEYQAESYGRHQSKAVTGAQAVVWPTKLYPRAIRGGSWDDDPDRLRSAARRGSHDDDWRGEDPNLPKSPWWFTSAPSLTVGFRIVRPLAATTPAERAQFWDADIASIRDDTTRRIDKDGRGARGIADPEVLKYLK
ncbi:MAG: formylglycine-generating enzyme family protein [Planctomycetota bacterium]